MLDFIRSSSGSFLTKIIFGIIILVFIFWGVGNYTSIGQHSVATVNGEQITTVEFHKIINNALRNSDTANLRGDKAAFEAFKHQSLNRMILQTLVKQEADKLGVMVTPQELQYVIMTIPAFLDEAGKFDKERYQAVLQQGQLTAGQFEKDIMDQLLMEKLMGYVAMGVSVTNEEVENYFNFIREERIAEYILFPLSEYTKAAKPDEEAIIAFYEANKNSFALPARVQYDYILVSPESLATSYTIDDETARAEYDSHQEDYMAPLEYNLRMIVLDIPVDGAVESNSGDSQEKATALRQAIADRLAAGEQFADLARELSVAPDAQKSGGSLGWVKEADLQAELAQSLAGLTVGEVSAPRQVEGRWYVFTIEDKKDAKLVPFEDVRDEIKQQLSQQKAAELFADMQNKADEGLRDGLDFDALSKTLGVALQSTELLPIEEADALVGLSDDSKTNLLSVQGGRPAPATLDIANGFALVFVKERLASVVPDVDTVRKEIVEILVKDMSLELAQADAEKCLQSIEDNVMPAVYEAKAQNSRKANRLTPQFAPLQGDAASLIAGLFSADKNVWLDKLYVMNEGVVVARVKSIIPAPKTEWEEMSGILSNALLQSKRDIYIQTFMEQLTEKAKIETNTAVLENMSFS